MKSKNGYFRLYKRLLNMGYYYGLQGLIYFIWEKSILTEERLGLEISKLYERSARVVKWYWGLTDGKTESFGMTLEDIGKKLGLTRERIRIIRERAIRILIHRMIKLLMMDRIKLCREIHSSSFIFYEAFKGKRWKRTKIDIEIKEYR